ncbi:MAG: NAD(P)H-binding protein [Betaproteobacteria bacterium]
MDIFVTGGTGYIGTRLLSALVARGHSVRALVRASSSVALPPGVAAVPGNALDPATFAGKLDAGDTLVHLVGTPHPNPSKALEFERVDLASIRASVAATKRARIAHLVYVSVAHPAPAMDVYVAARTAGEAAIAEAGLTATILRPWYVLGPGHWWPVALVPFYAIAEALPPTRDAARRLGLVSVAQMVRALTHAVESPPPAGTRRVMEVPQIRSAQTD